MKKLFILFIIIFIFSLANYSFSVTVQGLSGVTMQGGSAKSQGSPAGGGSSFDPFAVGTPIVVLDAAQGITLNGADVSQWDDLSANGNDVIQATAAKQPLYNTSDSNFNSLPSLTFDGAAEFLASVAYSTALTQPNTIFIVYKYADTGGQQFVYDGLTSTGRNALFSDDTLAKLYSGVVQNIHTVNTNVHIFAGLHKSTTSNSWLDGTAFGTGNTSTQTMKGLTLGSGTPSPVSLWAGEIAYVIVYNEELSDADRNSVGSGLATMFGTTWIE